MNIKHLVFLSPLLFAGCASVNSYNEPKSQNVATVSGSSTRTGLATWSNNSVTSIDNKQVGMLWSSDSKVKVAPASHLFVITTEFNLGFGTGPYLTLTEVEATVKPGMNYRFVSEPHGASLSVWAVDSNGQRVSKVGSSKYQYSPQQATYVVVH